MYLGKVRLFIAHCTESIEWRWYLVYLSATTRLFPIERQVIINRIFKTQIYKKHNMSYYGYTLSIWLVTVDVDLGSYVDFYHSSYTAKCSPSALHVKTRIWFQFLTVSVLSWLGLQQSKHGNDSKEKCVTFTLAWVWQEGAGERGVRITCPLLQHAKPAGRPAKGQGQLLNRANCPVLFLSTGDDLSWCSLDFSNPLSSASAILWVVTHP